MPRPCSICNNLLNKDQENEIRISLKNKTHNKEYYSNCICNDCLKQILNVEGIFNIKEDDKDD